MVDPPANYGLLVHLKRLQQCHDESVHQCLKRLHYPIDSMHQYLKRLQQCHAREEVLHPYKVTLQYPYERSLYCVQQHCPAGEKVLNPYRATLQYPHERSLYSVQLHYPSVCLCPVGASPLEPHNEMAHLRLSLCIVTHRLSIGHESQTGTPDKCSCSCSRDTTRCSRDTCIYNRDTTQSSIISSLLLGCTRTRPSLSASLNSASCSADGDISPAPSIVAIEASSGWCHLEAPKDEFQMKLLGGHPENEEARRVLRLSQGLVESLADVPLCLVLGSEGHGLSEKSERLCELVSIQMAGGFESLNVSVVGGIFFYMLQPKKQRISHQD
ncbi:hypothetical protein EZV62_014736 [Acer yangbiense]|uniref:tRNA/rRNA methyltransferase SpoU type domain-containing protein n=1 Tax=Acer yangbiense TaxID=1000413 RepID=A0A5C7HST2_9ROSI|nr:hypothetical protein EZV62_014736 [Acer yangbiense]